MGGGSHANKRADTCTHDTHFLTLPDRISYLFHKALCYTVHLFSLKRFLHNLQRKKTMYYLPLFNKGHAGLFGVLWLYVPLIIYYYYLVVCTPVHCLLLSVLEHMFWCGLFNRHQMSLFQS